MRTKATTWRGVIVLLVVVLVCASAVIMVRGFDGGASEDLLASGSTQGAVDETPDPPFAGPVTPSPGPVWEPVAPADPFGEIVDPDDVWVLPKTGRSAGGGRMSTIPEDEDDSLDFGLERAPVGGRVYEWRDGDQVRRVQLQLDLAVRLDDELLLSDTEVVDTGAGTIVQVPLPQGAGGAAGAARQVPRDGPVFLSDSGELASLPGGVLVVLDAEWTLEQVQGFFASNGVDWDDVSELGYVDNGYLVETEPGFVSLELANNLAGQPGVEIASPNWWTEFTRK